MKFNYVSKEVVMTPSMKEMVEKKFSKFDKFISSNGEIKTVVTVSLLPKKIIAVEVSMTKLNVCLRAKVKAADFYAAVDMLVDKLDGQLRKLKAQAKKSNKDTPVKDYKSLDFTKIEDDVEPVKDIVKRKTLSLAPMDVDEALCRMDALGHDFFIYLDSETQLINVLYTRDDGKYGVIEILKD